jgi:hypothetical protein
MEWFKYTARTVTKDRYYVSGSCLKMTRLFLRIKICMSSNWESNLLGVPPLARQNVTPLCITSLVTCGNRNISYRDVGVTRQWRQVFWLSSKEKKRPFSFSAHSLGWTIFFCLHAYFILFPYEGSRIESKYIYIYYIANLIDGLCDWQQSKWGFSKYDTYATCILIFFLVRQFRCVARKTNLC